jgi:hypothetical protein
MQQWMMIVSGRQKALQDAGIGETITSPRASSIAGIGNVSRDVPGEYCPGNRIGIEDCQPGCFG